MNTQTKNETEPLVSICVPVFNEERFITETLDSLVNQTYERFEVMVWDNASTDRTIDICSHYTETDQRFKLFQHKVNIGQVNNISRCYAGAKGDLVLLLSGNDVLAPTYLEEVVRMHVSDPDIGLVYSQSTWIDESSNPINKIEDEQYFETDCKDVLTAYTTLLERFNDPGSFFATYKRKVIEGLQPLRHVYGSDQIFVAESGFYGHVRCVDDYLFYSRVHHRQALPTVFSEHYSRGMPDNSILTKLDVLTPIMSLIAGHADMITKSRVPSKLKPQMVERARTICKRRGRHRIGKERDKLVSYVRNAHKNFKQLGKNHIEAELGRMMLLNKLLQASFVLPEDELLKESIAEFYDTE